MTESGQGGLDEEEEAARRRLQSLAAMRTFHERQVSLIERLPAAEVGPFLDGQRTRAARYIQSWWRKMKGREKERESRRDLSQTRTAVANERTTQLNLSPRHFPHVGARERETLQAVIDEYQRENPPPQHSEEEIRQRHGEVERLLSELYSREAAGADSCGVVAAGPLLEELEESCRLLEESLGLRELEREGVVDPRFLSPPSQTVAVMALEMHRKEMKAIGLFQ